MEYQLILREISHFTGKSNCTDIGAVDGVDYTALQKTSGQLVSTTDTTKNDMSNDLRHIVARIRAKRSISVKDLGKFFAAYAFSGGNEHSEEGNYPPGTSLGQARLAAANFER